MEDKFITIDTLNMLLDKGFEYLVYPTQSLAQKWLRETKNLHVEISYMYGNFWIYDILRIPNHDMVGLSDRPLTHYSTYEEALEAGIQEALKLVEE
ncbi:hypothetical protein [Bacteroides sp. BFG-606]|uniref:hypothetical protein n=1 Tax=Bacteroides sp. BFG-606 TaxID=2972763 RepID=UPI002166843E|nr:hypothetical protein [Bacteroides sp. BFG-606]MCS2335471.1 hypothetical protein [Bacteroides sp. BFG-606]